jgi:hypothetical protein
MQISSHNKAYYNVFKLSYFHHRFTLLKLKKKSLEFIFIIILDIIVDFMRAVFCKSGFVQNCRGWKLEYTEGNKDNRQF